LSHPTFRNRNDLEIIQSYRAFVHREEEAGELTAAEQTIGFRQLLVGLLRLHPLAGLFGPVVVLRVAEPEREDSVGQLPAMSVARMHPNQNGAVVATVDITGFWR
jgi:hypothetical protein